MEERLFCWRFDVDSHRCIREGVPNLVAMAARHDATFTFFVNMGRLTSRRLVAGNAIRSRLRSGAGQDVAPTFKLPLRRKLGDRGFVEALVRNPLAGAGAPQQVRAAAAAGHEIGLHGGRNHRLWQSLAPTWPQTKVRDEVAWGLQQLRAAGVHDVAGFSSPGWSGSPRIDAVLAESFAYAADRHGGAAGGPASGDGPIPHVVTNVLGEPHGVGYLEWHRAQGHTDAQILDDFKARLAASGRFAVAYDHPFWAGTSDLALTERLLLAAQEEGFRVVALREMATAS